MSIIGENTRSSIVLKFLSMQTVIWLVAGEVVRGEGRLSTT
jgi:hypothetical protein